MTAAARARALDLTLGGLAGVALALILAVGPLVRSVDKLTVRVEALEKKWDDYFTATPRSRTEGGTVATTTDQESP